MVQIYLLPIYHMNIQKRINYIALLCVRLFCHTFGLCIPLCFFIIFICVLAFLNFKCIIFTIFYQQMNEENWFFLEISTIESLSNHHCLCNYLCINFNRGDNSYMVVWCLCNNKISIEQHKKQHEKYISSLSKCKRINNTIHLNAFSTVQ